MATRKAKSTVNCEIPVWVLERTDDSEHAPVYDCTDGFVIVANSPARARQMASDHVDGNGGGEGADAWLDVERSSCRRLRPTSEAVVLVDFHAG